MTRQTALAAGLLGIALGAGFLTYLYAVPPASTIVRDPTVSESPVSHSTTPNTSPPPSDPILLDHSSLFLQPTPSLPIPWNALLRNSLPDDIFLPPEPEGPLLDLTDPEHLAATLRNRGETISSLYHTLSAEQRTDLILTLNSTGLLPNHAARFLGWEPHSEVRALLLECIDPMDFATQEDPARGSGMIALLDLPTTTPIGASEWTARMELASRISPELGAEWVRTGRQAFPDSANVSFTAAIITLVDGAGSDAYVITDRAEAAEALIGIFNGRNGGAWSAESRMRAYYALSHSPEPSPVAAFYRSRAAVETDPRAREVLSTLHARLLVRMTPLP